MPRAKWNMRNCFNGSWLIRHGVFTVAFCDERGSPFAEHKGLTEQEACEMVYSYAVNQRELEKRREEKSRMENQ